MSAKITNRMLYQESRALGEQRSFDIYNDKYIKVMHKGLFGERKYHLNLSMMEPWPVRHRLIAWRWLLALLYSGTTALAFILYVIFNPGMGTLGRLLPIIVIFVLLTLGSLVLFLYRSPNVMEFRSRYGSAVLISLLYKKPDATRFKSFVEEIKQRILAASGQVKIDKKQMLAIEMKEMRRLRDEGVLSREDFQRAKDRLMSLHV